MKNIFIITLGAREVQFKKENLEEAGFSFPGNLRGVLSHISLASDKLKVAPNDNYPEYLLVSEPRIGGKVILDYWELFEPVIELPLITGTCDHLFKDCDIGHVILVYTDQSDLSNKNLQHQKNLARDTLFFREIIRKKLPVLQSSESGGAPEDIAIVSKATDIDYQYHQFAVKCKVLFENESDISQIFLLAQGGIDQINYALTLQLIQAFGTKVKIWQQSEGERPKSLHFTDLFLKDLTKQKVLKHLADYDFGLVAEFSNCLQPEIVEYARYAYSRLNLDYSNLHPDFVNEEITAETKCRDLYLSAKIYFKRRDYGNYLWRLFTLLENFYRYRCEKVIGETESYFNPHLKENISWINKLKSIPGLFESIKKRKINGKPLDYNQPNRFVFKYMYNFFCKQKILEDDANTQNNLNNIFNISQRLIGQRNNIAHYLRPISKDLIEESLSGKSCDELNNKLDDIFYLDKGKAFGIYDDIRNKILADL